MNAPVLIQKRARVKGTVIPVVKLLHRVPVYSPAQFVSPCYTVTGHGLFILCNPQ